MLSLGRRGLMAAASTAVIRRRSALAAEPFNMTQVASGVWVRQGVCEDAAAGNDDAIANIGFIIGDDAVAIIDPGGSRSDGVRLLASLRAVTDRPVRYVVLSHLHPDHVFGCQAFTGPAFASTVFAAHANIIPAMAGRGNFYRKALADTLGADEAGDYVAPEMLVSDTATIDLGNRVLDLHAHGVAHTDNDLSVVDRRTGTVWAADLLFVDRIPALDGSLVGWLNELNVLQALPCVRAVPGHGPPSVAWPAGALDEQRYLRVLQTEIRALLAKDAPIEDAIASVGLSERDRWQLFDDYNGRNVTAAFKELEWD